MPKVATLCTIASAIGFYLSLNLGNTWPLAWVAPIPVLWLVFGETRGWIAFAATWTAYALGCCNMLPAYTGTLPVFVLAMALTVPALGFAGSALGAWRISHADETRPVRVGLAADDALGAASFQANAKAALDAVGQYTAVARELSEQGATLIVFPEKLAVLQSSWRADAISVLEATARASGATIVIGFDDQRDLRRNEALIFAADDAEPSVYFKRHMVPGLEAAFVPGDLSFVLHDQTGLAICKDMDFQSTLRSDARDGHPTLLAVPAWDFDRDGWWHARLAIMRGVEDGLRSRGRPTRASSHSQIAMAASLHGARARTAAWSA